MRLARLLLPAIVLAAALPATALGADAEAQLADRYSPVVRLVAHPEECGSGEPYVPTDVDAVLHNDEVALRGPWDSTNVVKVGPTAADLATGKYGYALDYPGNPLDAGCTYEKWSQRINGGRFPTVYAHVARDPAYPGQLALQYWFFYVYNDFNNKHEGDWEMIQLNFRAPDAEAALQTRPEEVGYSQHEGAERADWGSKKLDRVAGTHPVVYPAAGSHANYYRPALFLGRSAAQGVGCDDTQDATNVVRPRVAVLPSDEAEARAEYPWLAYQGQWGERQPSFYNGPTGPNLKTQWAQPITWSEEEWRGDSFSVPAGHSFGKSATDFFCGSVAAGSNLLTKATANPGPVVLFLLGIVVLLLWIASRTSWAPSPPLRLARRRSWGGIITASWALWRRHKALFFAIGALFIPLGVVISLLQYLLFQLVALAPLTDSAGETNAFVAGPALALGLLPTVGGLTFVQAATAAAMDDIDRGLPTSARRAYTLAASNLWTLLGALLRAAAVAVLLDLTVIGIPVAIWLVIRWSLLAQVIQLEDHAAQGALHRSARLVRGRWLRVATLTWIVTGTALFLGPAIGTLLLLLTTASFNFVNVIAGLVYMVTMPLAAVATTYLYHDLRTRKVLEPEDERDLAVLPAEIA